MELKLRDRSDPIAFETGANGRQYVTFTANEDMDSLSLISDCLGNVDFKDIQVELGDKATPFAIPVVYDEPRSGVFAYIDTINDELRQVMTSTKEGIQSEIAQSARDINLAIKKVADETVKSNSITIGEDGVVLAAGKSNKDFAKAVGSYFAVTPEAISLFSDLIKVKGDMIVDGSISTGKLRAGAVTADILASDAVMAKHLKVDNGLMDKLTANDVLVEKLTAKESFITKLNSVQITASNIKNALLQSLNGATAFNLNDGALNFYTDSPALRRVLSGYPNQFLSFRTGTWDGKPVGVTILGSNSLGEGSNGFLYAGLRIWNSNMDNRQVDDVGNVIRLTPTGYVEAFDTSDYGWLVNTKSGSLEIKASNIRDRFSSKISVGDLLLYRRDSTYSSLIDIINSLIDNIEQLHQNKHGEGYSYSLPNKFI